MLRISKWNETFETAKTRKLIHLEWIHFPSGVDSAGYLELMGRGEEGIQAFGVFVAICQWSATCRPTIRGTCARSDGKPLSVRQLALILRIDASVAENAISILASEEVGWLVWDEVDKPNEFTESPNGLPVVSQAPATNLPVVSVQGEERKEEKGNEGEGNRAIAHVAVATHPVWQETIRDCFDATFGATSRITAKRKTQLNARWKDAWWQDNWQAALDRGGQSSFLRGGNDRGWIIDLEFFLKPDTVTKILEGKYDDRQGTTKPNAAQQREALNASGFDWIRQAAARAAASGSEGVEPATGARETLFIEG